MRFAISAVGAASGLALLGLAFYGQPAVYLRQVGDQWDALMDRPSADQRAADERTEDADADGDRAVQLRAEVARLEAELAARRGREAEAPAALPGPAGSPGAIASAPAVPAGGTPGAADQAPAPSSMVISGRREEAEQALAKAEQARAEQAEQAKAEQARVAQAKADQARAEQARADQARAEQAKAEQARAEQAKADQARAEQARAEQARAEQAKAEQAKAEQVRAEQARAEQAKADQARAEQARAEQAKADQAKAEQARAEQARAEQAKAEQARAQQARADQAKAEQARVDAASQAASRLAAKPLPAPPPPLPVPPRQEADDTQSVLARLRQIGPAQRPETPAPAEPRAVQAASPSLPRLSAARSALANGRIEDARRLLQEAQLQLVFGPAGDGSPSVGRGSADVARALDALSANDVSLGRRYVEVAMSDLSGSLTNPPAQEPGRRVSGYAPAYPPR